MTFRTRHLRASVRLLTQSTDATWGTPDETYTHDRYQQLRALAPMSGDAVLRYQREGFYADWQATARRKPAIPDGCRLVTFDGDGNVDLTFHVRKVLPRGHNVVLLLQEINEEQA